MDLIPYIAIVVLFTIIAALYALSSLQEVDIAAREQSRDEAMQLLVVERNTMSELVKQLTNENNDLKRQLASLSITGTNHG